MPTQHFKVLIEYDPQDKVWVTYVPAMDHMSTYGETQQETLENTKEAMLGYPWRLLPKKAFPSLPTSLTQS